MELTLIFPHQLFQEHPALESGREVVLIEDPLLFGTDPAWPQQLHRQKLILHRASMQAFADALHQRGFSVRVQRHDEATDTTAHLQKLYDAGYRSFHCVDPVDDLLERRLTSFASRFACRLELLPTPMLLTPSTVVEEFFGRGRRPLMAAFYAMQRKRLNLLIEPDGSPCGGRWSLDADNRKKLPKGIEVPEPPTHQDDRWVEQARPGLETEALPLIGSGKSFAYPVTHAAAESWLIQFVEQRFQFFGTYEDAISTQHRVLWHSVLTPMLNVGLLTPQQVLNRILERAYEGDIPLNSLEGFIRQLIGWREFMAVMYRRHGIEMRNGNFWGCEDKPLPKAFYTGSTGLPPVDDAIHRALSSGYCHHIERLMLLGNVMLLCGFHPRRVCTWFMELFVDAYDWVMVPNVHGMSQFGDGGIFTTKPYISGSNYVLKMSDYRRGDWCKSWDGLFWSFIARHEKFFRAQPRLAMMTKNLDRMPAETLATHRQSANDFLDGLT